MVPRRRLRVLVPPVVGLESFNGYLLRLSEANGYEGSAWIIRDATMSKDFAFRGSDGRSLADLTGLGLGEIAELLCWRSRATGTNAASPATAMVSPEALDLHRPKVCPICLSVEPWARRLWDVRALVACPAHGCLLLDVCPACGRRLSWNRPSLHRCKCNANLTAARVQPAHPDLVAVANVLSALSSGAASPLSSTPVSTLDATARLLCFMAADPTAAGGSWRRQYMSRQSVSVAWPLFLKAAPILLDWPAGLHGWLKAQGLQGRSPGMRQTFGSALDRILATLRGPDFNLLRQELRQWLAEKWDGGFVRPWSPLFTKASAPTVVSASSAARRLGVSPTTVAGMLDRGELEGKRQLVRSRRVNLISSEGIERTIRELANALTADEAGAFLGVSGSQVRVLARAQLLVSVGRNHGKGRLRRYSRSALERLVEQIASRSADAAHPEELTAVATVAAERVVSTMSVISAILAGRLAVWKFAADPSAPGLERYGVDVRHAIDDRAAASGKAVLERCLSVRQGAKALSVSVRMVPVLVAAGCLATAGGTGGGKLRKRTLTRASVSRFHAEYVMARELASSLKTSTRSIGHRLGAAGARPVVEGDSQAGISSVWRRAGIDAFLR